MTTIPNNTLGVQRPGRAGETAARALLTLDQLRVGYGSRALLPAVSLTIREQDLWVVVGSNGSGKSTLLKTALGLLPPISGKAQLAENVRVSFVPQRSQIDYTFPVRVVDYVADGLDRGWSFINPLFRFGRFERVRQALRTVGLFDQRFQPLRQLSEGQRQRAMLARATVSEPSLLVLDEPTSALDIRSERAVFELLDTLRATQALGIVVVVHHLHAVARKATHFLMVDGDHQVLVAGPADTVTRHPAFVGHYGVFEPCPAEDESEHHPTTEHTHG